MPLVIGMSTSGPVLGVNLSKKLITCLAGCSIPPAFSRWSIAISAGPCYVDFPIAFISGYERVVLSFLQSCILPAGQTIGKAVIKFIVARGTGRGRAPDRCRLVLVYLSLKTAAEVP
jgi:hypothetical protein